MNEESSLHDRLTGALIGLARATFGNTHPTEDTWRLLLRGLCAAAGNESMDAPALDALADEVCREKARLVPSCAHCASPCGRNDDYDMKKLRASSADVRALKTRILSAAAAAAHAVRADEQKEETGRFAAKALFAVGEDWDAELLLPVVREAEQRNGKEDSDAE